MNVELANPAVYQRSTRLSADRPSHGGVQLKVEDSASGTLCTFEDGHEENEPCCLFRCRTPIVIMLASNVFGATGIEKQMH